MTAGRQIEKAEVYSWSHWGQGARWLIP